MCVSQCAQCIRMVNFKQFVNTAMSESISDEGYMCIDCFLLNDFRGICASPDCHVDRLFRGKSFMIVIVHMFIIIASWSQYDCM